MVVDKIIFASDDNPNYLDLWKYVSKMCKLTLGVTPVLFHITDEYSDFKQDEFGVVKKIKKHPEIPTSFQAQLYRLYGTKFFPNESCLISDIDMFTFNYKYFIEQVELYEPQDFIVYLSDAYDLSRPDTQQMWALNRVPMCYVLGLGSTFTKLIKNECDFNEYVEKVLDLNFGYEFPIFHRDEIFLGKCISRNFGKVNIIKLKRNIDNINNIPGRINREDFYNFQYDFLYDKTYIDCHIPSNWVENINEFENIFKTILTYN
jgi:hypothetical protein